MEGVKPRCGHQPGRQGMELAVDCWGDSGTHDERDRKCGFNPYLVHYSRPVKTHLASLAFRVDFAICSQPPRFAYPLPGM